jgi:hypothetical protein
MVASVADVLVTSVWPGVVLCLVLYTADYAMTLVTARLYATRAKQKMVIEGSFELNPLFEKDVDSGRLVSKRWVIGLAVVIVLMALLWHLANSADRLEGYLFALGGMVFLQLALQMRHLRNWFLFATALGDDGLRGRIEYPRWVALSVSAFEFLLFAALYGIAYLASQSILLLGGATTCVVIAVQHYLLSRKARKSAAARDSDNRGVSA